MYTASIDTVKFLGLNKLDELPNFKETRHEIAQFIKDNSKDAIQ
jgi:hypothetical protein